MTFGMQFNDDYGAINFSTASKSITVIDSFFVGAGASDSRTYSDPVLNELNNAGKLSVVAYEVPYGSYPLSQAPVKKSITYSSGGSITVSVSGGNMNARILVMLK